MTLIVDIFLRLRPAKSVVRYMCKSLSSDYPSKRNRVNGSGLCLNMSESTCGIFIAQRKRTSSCKKSFLVICQRLRLFVKTMSVVDKCSLPNRDNLMQPIHMQLSQKLKTFSEFFLPFSKSRLNFEHFQKKDDAHSLFISEATACKKRG